MVLPHERWPGEIAQVERVDLPGRDVGIQKAALPGLYRERPQVPLREGPERRLSNADYRNWSHNSRTQPKQALPYGRGSDPYSRGIPSQSRDRKGALAFD